MSLDPRRQTSAFGNEPVLNVTHVSANIAVALFRANMLVCVSWKPYVGQEVTRWRVRYDVSDLLSGTVGCYLVGGKHKHIHRDDGNCSVCRNF
jgi:hypothetical protein